MNTIMKIVLILNLIFIVSFNTYSQSSTLKLPTSDHTSSFDITSSSGTLLSRFFGDGGFYVRGSVGTGNIPIDNASPLLMWYPKKAAFRAGFPFGNNWSDAFIGIYSMSLGYATVASGEFSIAFGGSVNATGNNSIAIGYGSTASGDYSTVMGYAVSTGLTNFNSGSFVIGDHSTNGGTTFSSADNQMTMRFAGGYRLFTNSGATIGASLPPGANSWTTISDSTKKCAFLPVNGEDVLNKISQFNLRSWSYKAQDSTKFRHYGPMAQEFYNAFGHDKYGTIGNDTTISTSDLLGINLIAIQALEKRTEELMKVQKQLLNKVNELKKLKEIIVKHKIQISKQQSEINKLNDLKTRFTELKKMVLPYLKQTKNKKVKYASDNVLN